LSKINIITIALLIDGWEQETEEEKLTEGLNRYFKKQY